MFKNKSILICVSGGSGSGKSTVAEIISKNLIQKLSGQIICQDSYYLPFKEKTIEERKRINFDHPNAFDWDLLIKHIKQFLSGKDIQTPIYDYKKYTRLNKTKTIKATSVLILEGLITFYHPQINQMANLKIFVDTPSDERLIRRIEHDNIERGRPIQSVIKQWRSSVRPMYKEFIEKQKEIADLIIPWYSINEIAMKAISGAIKDFVSKK